MTVAIYAGSFDPITYGHIDILKQGLEIFDKIIIAVAYNEQKPGFLPVDKRIMLINECIKNFSNVEVASYNGLTVDYTKKCGVSVLLRGLRNSADFEYEKQLSQVNNTLDKNIKTVFLISNPKYSYVSSSAVREILNNKGDISSFVPETVKNYLEKIR